MSDNKEKLKVQVGDEFLDELELWSADFLNSIGASLEMIFNNERPNAQ